MNDYRKHLPTKASYVVIIPFLFVVVFSFSVYGSSVERRLTSKELANTPTATATRVVPKKQITATVSYSSTISPLSTITPTLEPIKQESYTFSSTYSLNSSTFSPSDIKYQLGLFVAGGGGAGPEDGCLREHNPTASYSHPTVVSKASYLNTRPISLPPRREEWMWTRLGIKQDVCACGFQDKEKVRLSLVNPLSETIFITDSVSRKARDWNNIPLDTISCVASSYFTFYDFIPGDPLGEYKIVFQGQSGVAEHHFTVTAPTKPAVYYSDRLHGYVFVGFKPFEKIVVGLKIGDNLTGVDFKGINIEMLLDGNGVGLLSTLEMNKPMVVVRGEPTSIDFEVLSFYFDADIFTWFAPLIEWNSFVKSNPSNPNIFYNRGKYPEREMLSGKEDPEKIRADFTRAIELDPNHFLAYFERGKTYMFEGYNEKADYQKATADLSQAIEISPTFLNAYYERAKVFQIENNFEKAILDFSEIIRLDPDAIDAYAQRGLGYVKLGRYDLAIKDFDQVIQLNPSYQTGNYWWDKINIYSHRGGAHYRLGNTKQAASDVQTALIAGSPHPLDQMSMVFVPAGEFSMGSKPNDFGAEAIDQPQHTVYLDAFWIDSYEVHNRQYALCVKSGACQSPRKSSSATRLDYYTDEYADNPYASSYPEHPVINVAWKDAQEYCQWVGRRLPTEAEWEKAARGTDARLYPWGNASPNGMAQFSAQDTESAFYGGGLNPVGFSPYMARDMAGNVWEWVADYFSADYYATSPDENPLGPATGRERVLRGGSWKNKNPAFLRTANRTSKPEDYFSDSLGFRCALSSNK